MNKVELRRGRIAHGLQDVGNILRVSWFNGDIGMYLLYELPTGKICGLSLESCFGNLNGEYDSVENLVYNLTSENLIQCLEVLDRNNYNIVIEHKDFEKEVTC